MSIRPLKRGLVGLVSLALAAPMPPLPVMAQDGRPIDPDKPSDGVVSPAACRVFAFTLPEERNADYAAARRMAPPVVGGAAPAFVAPMPPPPPPPPPPPSAPPPPVLSAPSANARALT